LQSNPDYVETDARPATSAAASRASAARAAHPRRPQRRPRAPSSVGYLLTTGIVAAGVFAGAWWLFSSAGDESPWLPASVFASLVLLVSMAAREVVMRRAWARYTRGLELEMGSREAVAAQPATSMRQTRAAASVHSAASSLRALQQRLAAAEEAGGRQPEAHLEAYRLCEQYLANSEEAIRSPRTSVDVRMALRAGQERVRDSRRHHLLAWARGEAQRLTHEAQRRASVSGRIETAQGALEVINEALQVCPEERELKESALAVRNYIASVKVAHWVELAERAAFRGRHERAVARYRDALFYLSRAEMSEDAREAAASRINREIEMLRARIATGELAEEPRRPRPRKTRKAPGARARTPPR
jgi:tetratricopeptide (TPR) repeat protein